MAERVTQNRIIRLFTEKLDYTYLGNLEGYDNRNIDEPRLKAYLKKAGYDERVISRAVFDLTTIASNISNLLYNVNLSIYTLLRYGQRVKPAVDEEGVRVHYIRACPGMYRDAY